MAADQVGVGYSWISDPVVLSLRMIFYPWFSVSVLGLVSVSGLVFHPWISKINHLKLKLMFYNMLIITCLLILLNLFKIDSSKYLLFVASYLYM
jgi:hypothetical protein